jgi:hypothetical protein
MTSNTTRTIRLTVIAIVGVLVALAGVGLLFLARQASDSAAHELVFGVLALGAGALMVILALLWAAIRT